MEVLAVGGQRFFRAVRKADFDAINFPFPVVEDPEGMDALHESGEGFLPSPGAVGLKEFKDEMRGFKDESERDRKRMNKAWGDLANKLGTIAEDIVARPVS